MLRLRWLRPVLPLVLALCLTGCVSFVVGRPSAATPSDRAVGRSAGDDVTIVGATDDPVDDLARDALTDLQDYWADQFPDVFGQEFTPLEGGYFSVDPNDVAPGEYPQGVGCGAQPLEVEGNAFYCQSPGTAHSDSISYDRAFLAELAGRYGEFIPALVMAHEFGHAVQARVGTPGASIAIETQADCFAGSWTAWVADGDAARSRLREPELDELLRGYFLLRDPVGTSTAEQSAHGSYFDRVSAFQEGFDDGPEACRDNFGRDRVFTQGSFRDNDEALTGGNAEYPSLLRIINSSLPTVWGQAFRDLFHENFTAPSIEPFRGTAPSCAPDRDLDLVYCADEDLVGFDETDLAGPAYSKIGDFAVATAAAVPYSLAVRDQLGLSTDDQDAARSALCLTGWYAAKVFNRQAGAQVRISPGDIDESVQFLLSYGDDPQVLGAADLSGFQQVDLFRSGFVEGLGTCDVGA
jgi:predicted metalloprotease